MEEVMVIRCQLIDGIEDEYHNLRVHFDYTPAEKGAWDNSEPAEPELYEINQVYVVDGEFEIEVHPEIIEANEDEIIKAIEDESFKVLH